MSLIGLIRAGDIWGAILKIIALVRGNPAVATYLHQFDTAFGNKALSEADKFKDAVIADPSKFLEEAEKLFVNLWNDAWDIAKEEAFEVTKNALRLQVEAAKIDANTAVA